MGSWINDFKYGIRTLAHRPVLTAVAILSIALGVGANGAVFSLVNGLLLRPPAGVAAPDELARVFVARYARQLGRELAPLSEVTLERLRGHGWPGNVRELSNVIERGVIVSTGGVFDIERALPGAAPPPPAPVSTQVHTLSEMQALERANIERALARASGKVAGKTGAAALLGTHPSTLSSRMRSLGIKRPAR